MEYFINITITESYKKTFKYLPSLGLFNNVRYKVDFLELSILSKDNRVYSALNKDFRGSLDSLRDNRYDFFDEYREDKVRTILRSLKKSGKSKNLIAEELYNFLTHKHNIFEDSIIIYTLNPNLDYYIISDLLKLSYNFPSGMFKGIKSLHSILENKAMEYVKDLKQPYILEDSLYKLMYDFRDSFPSPLIFPTSLEKAKWNLKLYNFLNGQD